MEFVNSCFQITVIFVEKFEKFGKRENKWKKSKANFNLLYTHTKNFSTLAISPAAY